MELSLKLSISTPVLRHLHHNTFLIPYLNSGCPQTFQTFNIRIGDMQLGQLDLGVIIPTYNHGKFLSSTLSSLVNQSYKNIKIVVVDDCSTDNTQEILSEFTNNLRISVIKNLSNFGESESINIGWGALQTRFVAVVSADDPQTLNWAKDMMKFIENNPGFIGYYPDLRIINDEGVVTKLVKLTSWNTKTAIERLVCFASAGSVFDRKLLPHGFVPRDRESKYPSDLIQILNIAMFGDLKHVVGAWGTWRESSFGLTNTLGGVFKAEDMYKTLRRWQGKNSNERKTINLRRMNANLYSQMWKLYRKDLSILDSASSLFMHMGVSYLLNPLNFYQILRAYLEYSFYKIIRVSR